MQNCWRQGFRTAGIALSAFDYIWWHGRRNALLNVKIRVTHGMQPCESNAERRCRRWHNEPKILPGFRGQRQRNAFVGAGRKFWHRNITDDSSPARITFASGGWQFARGSITVTIDAIVGARRTLSHLQEQSHDSNIKHCIERGRRNTSTVTNLRDGQLAEASCYHNSKRRSRH